jgi:hypothetical protein
MRYSPVNGREWPQAAALPLPLLHWKPGRTFSAAHPTCINLLLRTFLSLSRLSPLTDDGGKKAKQYIND